jgi:hypothetical protein
VRDFVHYDREDKDGYEKDGFHGVLKLTPPSVDPIMRRS